MLSKEEKKELIQDGQSPKRREEFSQAKKIASKNFPSSLDDYLKFLKSVQNIFPPPPASCKKTITRLNLL